jgi:uncharacterized protein (TIGR02145 family)
MTWEYDQWWCDCDGATNLLPKDAVDEFLRGIHSAIEDAYLKGKAAGEKEAMEACREKAVPELDTFTDPRDGRVYKTVRIGKQTWLAENLAFDYAGSKVYGNDLANVAKYGRLYNWETAKKAVPPGWHLPTNAEWDELVRFADGSKGTDSPYDSKTAGKLLKAASGWSKDGNGTDEHGFSALPGGGGYSGGDFDDVGSRGFWWSATEDGADGAYRRGMGYYEDVLYSNYYKDGLLSVRCLQDCGGINKC